MKELFLDTTVGKQAKVVIKVDGKNVVEVISDQPLIAVQEALAKASLELRDIDTFLANPGPGSYTGVRIGLAVINALNFSLGKKAKTQEPKYQ